MSTIEYWKSIEMMLPSTLSADDVRTYARDQIRIVASEAGEFVQQIRVGVGVDQSGGYTKWTASYLTGPPGEFPA